MAVVFLVLMLLPVCYLSFLNRASGDDYGYGAYTRTAWFATHSVTEVLKAIWRTIRQYYYGWQGTWFSIFLFALQPEVFSDKAYVVVAFLMLFLWIGSTVILFKEILVHRLRFDKWSFLLITTVFLVIGIQFVPSTKSAIFWYNGCAHYLIPFAMGQMLIYMVLRFADGYKVRYYAGICIFMTLLGGSNYQAALFALIVTVYAGIADYIGKRDKRIFLLILPMVLEMIGLVISMTAPGNKVRGGEDFGLSVSKAAETVGLSFLAGIKDVGSYITGKPLVFVGLFILFLVFLETFKRCEGEGKISYPFIRISALVCLYSAMQAPAIYAGVDVSRGVLNMNFQTFLLTVTGVILIVAEKISVKTKLTAENIHQRLVIPGMVLVLCLIIVFRSNIKDSTSYVCVDYISTGQAADYKEQMDQQTMLLTGDEEKVVLPFINDVQGPLMHMPVTDNPEAWTNKVVSEFYGKESVVAMPRTEWNELYGEKIEEK